MMKVGLTHFRQNVKLGPSHFQVLKKCSNWNY